MKKFISLFFIFQILITNLTVSAKTFFDISSDHNNYNAVNSLSEKGIIKGYTDGNFKPDQQITRAELTKIVLGSNKIIRKKQSTNCFPDVGYLEWYSDYICTAKKTNYINGYDDGSFKPEQFINKAEALKIIAKIHKWKLEFDETSGTFSDIPNDAWYINYIRYGIEKNLFKGLDDENINLSDYQFEPGKFITRGEIAEILYRYLVITELNKYSFSTDQEKIIQKKTYEKDETEIANPSIELPNLTDGEVKINLSWKQADEPSKKTPKTDLDGHLIVSYYDENDKITTEEVDFAHKLNRDISIILETKENNEIINILKLKSPAIYEYFVYNFNDNNNPVNSEAGVGIHDQKGLAKYYVPREGKGKIWKIFEINEDGEILDFNQIGDCTLIKGPSEICPKVKN